MRQLLLVGALISAMPIAHAGFMDALNAASQIANSLPKSSKQQSVTQQTASSQQLNTTPLSSYTIGQMDCPSLEIAALNSSRELELVKANIAQIDSLNSNPQYQQQKTVSSAIGALGGLLAQKGGSTGEYARAAQQLGSASANSPDLDLDTQLALGKKYMSDLDSIRIYQKHKKCQ